MLKILDKTLKFFSCNCDRHIEKSKTEKARNKRKNKKIFFKYKNIQNVTYKTLIEIKNFCIICFSFLF